MTQPLPSASQLLAALRDRPPARAHQQLALIEAARLHGILYPLNAAWEQHRLTGKAAAALRMRLKSQAMQALARSHALAGILHAAEERRLGILPVKGPALSLLLHGRVEWRPSVDLDLVIAPYQAEAIFQLLLTMDFRPNASRCPRTPEEAASIPLSWTLHHGRSGITLDVSKSVMEIHYNQAFNEIYTQSRALPVTLRDSEIRLPSAEILYLYLAQHAARHRGSRLMWLFDLRAIRRRWPAFDRRLCREIAAECGLLNALEWADEWQAAQAQPDGMAWVEDSRSGAREDLRQLGHLVALQDSLRHKLRFFWRKLTVLNYADWLALPPGTPYRKLQLRRYPRLARRVEDWLLDAR